MNQQHLNIFRALYDSKEANKYAPDGQSRPAPHPTLSTKASTSSAYHSAGYVFRALYIFVPYRFDTSIFISGRRAGLFSRGGGVPETWTFTPEDYIRAPY